MPRQYPAIIRGTFEYDEVCRILGKRLRWTLDESVTQISNRWLKADMFEPDPRDPTRPRVRGRGLTAYICTRRRRIRIPRGSFLTLSPEARNERVFDKLGLPQ